MAKTRCKETVSASFFCNFTYQQKVAKEHSFPFCHGHLLLSLPSTGSLIHNHGWQNHFAINNAVGVCVDVLWFCHLPSS